MLRTRSKWVSQRRNLKVGDLVLMVDGDAPRGSWPKAWVEEILPSLDGVVRKVKVRTTRGDFSGAGGLPQTTVLMRPSNKLVLVLPVED